MGTDSFIEMVLAIAALLSAGSVAHRPSTSPGAQDAPEKVTVCQLKSDPAKYNHRLVEVTGFISHGFEDFSLFDPTCTSWPDVWLDYGGNKESDTMYCCGVAPGQVRPKQVSVEGISIPLIDDDRFKEFDKVVRSRIGTIMHGTIVGRFFSGQQTKYTKGAFWGGYGHMGCCTLLMIQQVLSVDIRRGEDLDYGDAPDQPTISKVGCGFSDLIEDWRFDKAVELQRLADAGQREWMFREPERVATETLATLLNIDSTSIKGLKQKRRVAGRIVYEWRPAGEKATLMLVVSRPYVLTFYSQDPAKIAWVVIAAYRSSCDRGNSSTRIK